MAHISVIKHFYTDIRSLGADTTGLNSFIRY